MDDPKHCDKCNTTKPRWQFNVRARSRDGLDHTCTDCRTRVHQIAWAKNRHRAYNDLRNIGIYDAEVPDMAFMYENDCAI